MAYDRDKMFKKALMVIDRDDCVTLDELSKCLGIDRTTLYVWGFDKNNEIKDAIESKKTEIKRKMRRRWRDSDNAALNLAEFKLLATDEEREAISMQTVKQDTNLTVQGKPSIQIDFGKEG